MLGHRTLFIAGIVLFLVSSLLCGLAWSGPVLIIARVVQGVSAAIMSPTALALLMTTFDEGPERNRALAIWTGTGAFGATAALLVGGVLTDLLGWEWIFFLNVPVALAMLVLAPSLLRESTAPIGGRKFDVAGALTSTAAFVLLIFAVVEAPTVGWGSGRTIIPLVAAAVLLMAFVFIEKRSAAPLVPLRIFRSTALVGGNLMMILVGLDRGRPGHRRRLDGHGFLHHRHRRARAHQRLLRRLLGLRRLLRSGRDHRLGPDGHAQHERVGPGALSPADPPVPLSGVRPRPPRGRRPSARFRGGPSEAHFR
ncbi:MULTISPECIES: MFS transporter [Saccharothrix]|uniref:MFS transporter n=1 Tax=Saccharothrix TaxID=2071 RepID=UPI000ABF07A9|nr:MFS transporter [Saccharothrix sp. CB00851]